MMFFVYGLVPVDEPAELAVRFPEHTSTRKGKDFTLVMFSWLLPHGCFRNAR